jgi:6-pyruvoyltetrahydropterin/6-carboxytetrahydropterin synthase
MSEITIRPVESKVDASIRAQAEIFREFTFEAAHRLPYVPDDHKCSRLHGHSYRIEVRVSGPVGSETGWVVDFADLKEAWKPLHETLDHHYLNEVPGLENPTSENLARWIWERLALNLDGLSEVVVRETCTSGCSFRGKAK